MTSKRKRTNSPTPAGKNRSKISKAVKNFEDPEPGDSTTMTLDGNPKVISDVLTGSDIDSSTVKSPDQSSAVTEEPVGSGESQTLISNADEYEEYVCHD